MKLELKQLAPYLPYGLKVQTIDGIKQMKGVDSAPETVVGVRYYHKKQAKIAFAIDVKPILRPMSDLTKEIGYDGEIFKPIDYISTSIKDSQSTMRRVTNNQGLDILEYWKIERLLELHFDVFGLIPAGLATDINNI